MTGLELHFIKIILAGRIVDSKQAASRYHRNSNFHIYSLNTTAKKVDKENFIYILTANNLCTEPYI